MSKKISAFGVLAGGSVDTAADIIPINDVSVAAASQNKIITPVELNVALLGVRPPTTSVFNFTANSSGATQSVVYDAMKGLSLTKTDGGAGAERICFNGKAVPAGTGWTASAKVRVGPQLNSGSQISSMGISLYDSGTGKIIIYGLQQKQGDFNLCCSYFSSLTAFSSEISTIKINSMGYPPGYFRFVESASSYSFEYSFDDGQT